VDKKYKKSYFDKFNERDENSKMSLHLIDYTGTYESDMYGKIVVSVKDKKMNLDVNNGIKIFELEWWENDVFITDKDEKWREKLFVLFNIRDNSVRDLTIYNAKFKKVN
jgi:hypothetical protein